MRRAAAFLIATALTMGGVPSVARASSAGDDLRARRADLLARIAAQTDEAEQDAAAVVLAQGREQRATAALATARQHLQERAVEAYMFGLTRSLANLASPNVYLEDAFKADQRAIADLRAARAARVDALGPAESARDTSRAAQAQLDAERAQLEATITHQDALDAQLQAAAAARQAAAAAQASTNQGVLDRFETDPAARTRHRVATVNQRQLMGRYPFGPVTGVPAGLKASDQVITGPASWYGPGFDGRPTASGAIYDQEGWTCASKELPLGTILLVSENGHQVLLLVNDRGPYVDGWILDLSHATATALQHPGVGVVTAQVLTPA
ncbi:MAG TPA: septal ring lytic transglycosylase RlpA family protein [Acidimicrobiales bacterium]|jgi:rare lipoprotein A (peptidoglycan hydrolase)|nr:septal ring lytic transglycosylase RlpA family protein [Acidimicrobiales bacterium]